MTKEKKIRTPRKLKKRLKSIAEGRSFSGPKQVHDHEKDSNRIGSLLLQFL